MYIQRRTYTVADAVEEVFADRPQMLPGERVDQAPLRAHREHLPVDTYMAFQHTREYFFLVSRWCSRVKGARDVCGTIRILAT